MSFMNKNELRFISDEKISGQFHNSGFYLYISNHDLYTNPNLQTKLTKNFKYSVPQEHYQAFV